MGSKILGYHTRSFSLIHEEGQYMINFYDEKESIDRNNSFDFYFVLALANIVLEKVICYRLFIQIFI